MNTVAKICVWLAIVSVLAAVPPALIMIWRQEWYPSFGTALQTLGVVFVASAMILAVVRMVTPRPPGSAG